jgi:uncharacterized coiled-coil protein SlyX
MSLASIFAKFDDLERKISAINASAGSVSNANGDPAALDAVLQQRLDALEAAVAQQPNLESLTTRLAVLEAKVMPSELPQKVENIENVLSNFQTVISANASDIQTLTHKLEHLENVTFPHVVTRLENVEHKVTETV